VNDRGITDVEGEIAPDQNCDGRSHPMARTAQTPSKGHRMKLAHFFIDHPRFATVINIFITIFGLATLSYLPVAQYPNIVPPTVQITTFYPGASAETIARTVATPLEQAVNGVENMDYIRASRPGTAR
jgi:hypothetical protein